MTDELKTQITALRAAIMRRVEFDQCIHASSIEDEIGKWVREVFAEPDYHQMAWSGYAEKMEPKHVVAERNVLGQILVSTGDGRLPTWQFSESTANIPWLRADVDGVVGDFIGTAMNFGVTEAVYLRKDGKTFTREIK